MIYFCSEVSDDLTSSYIGPNWVVVVGGVSLLYLLLLILRRTINVVITAVNREERNILTGILTVK